MKKITLLLIFTMALTALQAQLSISGEYRPRTEFMHGYKAPMTLQGEMFSLTTSQRARINFDFARDKYKFGFSLQDVRAWGSTKQLVTGDGAFTSIHQAWGEVLFNKNFSMKLGRQELVYDDHRILGSVNWAQQARSHDLALFKYRKEGLKVHVGIAVNQVQTRPYNTSGNYKSMQFLWINKSFSKSLKLSILALNNGLNDTTLNNTQGQSMTTYSQIIGLRPVYKKGKLSLAMNLYYQTGDDIPAYFDSNDGLNHHMAYQAYNFRLDLGFKLSDEIKLVAGYELLSGNSQTDTTTAYSRVNHAFMPLYGTNHKFNGWMDYFYVGNHKNSVGLKDAFAGLNYSKGKLLAGGQLHFFSAAAEVRDMDEFNSTGNIKAMPANLGTEIDTYVGYKYAPGVLFKAGFSTLFDTPTMRALKGGDPNANNYWGWMMIIVKPSFTNK